MNELVETEYRESGRAGNEVKLRSCLKRSKKRYSMGCSGGQTRTSNQTDEQPQDWGHSLLYRLLKSGARDRDWYKLHRVGGQNEGVPDD